MKYRSQDLLSGAWLGALAVAALADVASASPNNLTKIGSVVAQIEALNCSNKSFQALGLQIRATDEYVLGAICASPWDDSLRYAAISVSRDPDGLLVATSVSSIGASYVPGVSQVYLSGEVTDSNADVGSFAVLGSAAILFDEVTPRINEQIEVVGTQPQFGGPIIASSVSPSAKGAESGEQATSIIGTGIQAESIIGTGVFPLSIIGTGIQTNSIIGTGVSANSIIGTGLQANSIIGTGLQANSIIGTGVSLNSIIGTGVSTSSIIGTGVQANSIIGTGASVASVNSIIGTGSSTSSIIGTGVQANSIIGTGVSSNSIIGTGASTSSIIGTGVHADSIIGTGSL